MLQVVAPQRVFFGKKVLDDVAEPLDPDPQRMQRHLRPVAHGGGVQFARSGPSLKRQMLEYRAPGPDSRRSIRQCSAPLPPLLAVEFFKRCTSFMLELCFALFQNMDEQVCCVILRRASSCRFRNYFRDACVGIRARDRRGHLHTYVQRHRTQLQVLDPLHHDLDVAQRSESLEERLARLLHRLPVWIGIHRHHPVCHRAAASQRDPQIMHRIGAEVGGHVAALLQHAEHPVAQPSRFGGRFQGKLDRPSQKNILLKDTVLNPGELEWRAGCCHTL